MLYEYPETLFLAGFPPPPGYFDDTPEAARFREVAFGVAAVLGDYPLRCCSLATSDLQWDATIPPTPERQADLEDWHARLPMSGTFFKRGKLSKSLFMAMFGFLPCATDPPEFQHVWVSRGGFEPELDVNDLMLHAAYAFFRLRVGAETNRKEVRPVRKSAYPVHGTFQ